MDVLIAVAIILGVFFLFVQTYLLGKLVTNQVKAEVAANLQRAQLIKLLEGMANILRMKG